MRAIYKIIHTTCHTGWGGLEKRIFNESVWMSNQGHQIIIVAPKDTPLFDRAKSYGFRVYPVQFKRLGILSDYGQLVRIFKNERPNILNSHGNADSKIALKAAKKSGVPCRILSRHISAHVKNTWRNRKIYKQFSHYVFTTAGYTTRHLQNVFNLKETRIFSMPSGIIEPEQLIPKDEARNALAQAVGLDVNTRFIGFAGRVSPDKGVDLIIEAFQRISDNIDHHLVIVGNGSEAYLTKLKTMIDRLGLKNRIHLIGFSNDVWPYYRAFDCSILASRNKNGIPFEDIPRALLEAMYASCPVIGSKSGGITDIINHGKTGLLFDIDKPRDLADKIIETLSREASTLERIHAAREHVKKHHTIDVMGRNIIRIYRLHQVRIEKQLMA